MFFEKKLGCFVCGLVTGSLGLKALLSAPSKKACVEVAALGLRLKDNVLTIVDDVQANVDDVIAEAKVVNQEKKEAKSFAEANEETAEV